MNEMIVRNWNERVRPDDIVFHLGDVALGPWTDWHGILTRLSGYKVLVVGNHDRIFKGERPKMQERFASHYAEWFDEIHDNITGLELADGTFVNLSHFPYDGDSHDGDRYTAYRLPDDGTVLVHGHTHRQVEEDSDAGRKAARLSASKRGSPQVHVGMDSWSYAPVPEDEVINLIHGL